MCWMTMHQIINGIDGLLAPQSSATRVQLAQVLYKLMNR